MTPTADPDQARWNDYWTRYAAEYDEHQMSRLAHPEERETWSRVWADVLPAGPSTILDVGTGSGNVALLLAGAGHEVTGIDLAEGMLERARGKCAGHPHPPTFVTGDAVDPPCAPGSFDAIVSRYLLWTLRDAPTALRRWHELLRPGGVLVAVDAPWFGTMRTFPGGPLVRTISPPPMTRTPSHACPSDAPGPSRSSPSGRPRASRTCALIP